MSGLHDGRVIRGAVLTYRDDPAVVGPKRAVRFHRRGAVAVSGDGRIVWRGHASRMPERFASLPSDDHGEALVMPGFIDAHVHFPQYRMLAAPGKDLLDWLNRFTFPEEQRYASPPHARAAAEAFLDRLVQHGTTAAVVFSTVHRSATDTLFAAAERRCQAIVSGKTLMDRNAPEALRDDPASGVRDSEALIERWHRRGRLRYAITVRFAATSTEEQLREAGALATRYPDCHVHSHLSESKGEIELVRRLFPWAKGLHRRLRPLRPARAAQPVRARDPPLGARVREALRDRRCRRALSDLEHLPRPRDSSTPPTWGARTGPCASGSPPTWARARATRCSTPSARRTRWRCSAGARRAPTSSSTSRRAATR